MVDDRKISEMRNLGPAAEQDLNGVGIMVAADLVQLGAVQAFLQILNGRKHFGKSTQGCNAIYLYALYGAIHDLDWRAIPESKKAEFKHLTADMRATGQL